jgi:hypothetical protein
MITLLQHKPDGVVHRRDVVCIEGVTKPKHVRCESKPDELRVLRGIVKVGPPTRDMQQSDKSVEKPQARPFGAREEDAACG